jgi:hypothetical protein
MILYSPDSNALLAVAAGCANPQHTENLLSAAGFRTVIANTPTFYGIDRYRDGSTICAVGHPIIHA